MRNKTTSTSTERQTEKNTNKFNVAHVDLSSLSFTRFSDVSRSFSLSLCLPHCRYRLLARSHTSAHRLTPCVYISHVIIVNGIYFWIDRITDLFGPIVIASVKNFWQHIWLNSPSFWVYVCACMRERIYRAAIYVKIYLILRLISMMPFPSCKTSLEHPISILMLCCV